MKTYIIYDILNNMYFWEYRGERGFDLDIREAINFQIKEKAERELLSIKDEFERVLEIKEVYKL